MGDIYYALFRQKWKILLCSILGAISGAAYFKLSPPPFQSEAKLLVRFVVTDTEAVGPENEKEKVKSPDRGGETIMDSEQQMLTSLDLATQVAEAIGPKKILAKSGGGADLTLAADEIHKNLFVEVPLKSSVMRVSYKHADETLVQSILRELVNRYQKIHKEIHQSGGKIGDFLTHERDDYRQRLLITEQSLQDLRNKAGVISVADAKKEFASELAAIREQVYAAEVDFADKSAVLQQLSKDQNDTPQPTSATPDVAPLKAREYAAAIAKVEQLRKAEFDLLVQFTPESTRVLEAHRLVTEAEAEQARLEKETPDLLRTSLAAAARPVAPGMAPPVLNLAQQAASLVGLQQRMKVLREQYENVRKRVGELDQYELKIAELERQRDREAANLNYYSAKVEQNQVNEQLTGNAIQSIAVLEAPTPAFADWAKTYRTAIMYLIGGIVVGIGWALVIEMYFDRSVKRPRDLERLSKYPLFLSIPAMRRRRLKKARGPEAAAEPAAASTALQPNDQSGVATVQWEKENSLHLFHETLRDRLIGYFESRGLTHKPKVVAVTGLASGAGVTTTAAGLAASLSETGDGNVLLVDLNPGQNTSRGFYRGKPMVGLDELLESRDSAQIDSNLFMAADSLNEKLSKAMPQRFSKLVPKLKASDFDYIIFDMPPVSQISITPRLAGFMDMVLLVVESEKNHRDLVQRASALLAESNAHVGVILNKTKNYVPKALYHDALEAS